ncbi:AbrB/MazE/SpoVT family DNA-binding domain-containing protein [Ferroglobus sp.]|uniref:AbrB/MazE/SpoVT family DNA-binding domain-containing protein n=1 Tax=Ferroglobus sp. TaxID=2614230 RepID=UPI00345BEE69
MESDVVRVGKKFTLVIPKKVREMLGIKEGDLLSVKVKEGKIIMEPKKFDPFQVLERIIGEPYDERRDEKKAEEWLRDACS